MVHHRGKKVTKKVKVILVCQVLIYIFKITDSHGAHESYYVNAMCINL